MHSPHTSIDNSTFDISPISQSILRAALDHGMNIERFSKRDAAILKRFIDMFRTL